MHRTLVIALLLVCGAANAESIPLIREHGIFMVPVLINDKITLNFTIDSGASDVSIPADVFSTLIRTGTIAKKDLLGTQEYELADGSQRTSQQFRIRSLRIGNLELQDVTASVSPSAGSLLLGQSFLERFKYWSIDNQRHLMLINESPDFNGATPVTKPRPSSMNKTRSLYNSGNRAPGILVAELPSEPAASHQSLAEKVAAENLADEESHAGIHHRTVEDIDWTKYLDPLANGGWVLKYKAVDGAWALFTSRKDRRRIGKVVTLWLRWEHALEQTSPFGAVYLSYVEKTEFDCANKLVRTLAQTTFPENNLRGNPQSFEVDVKTAQWTSFIPGTQGEANFYDACAER